jgi:Zn-dependent protease
MHWLMALMIGIYLVKGATHPDHGGWWGLGWMSITMTILIVSILFHEYAHCWMAGHQGGGGERILLWPLGGLATVHYHPGPWPQIKVAGVGPLSSFVLSAACFGALVLTGVPWEWELALPFDSWWPYGMTTVQVFILHAARLNLLNGLFNLLVPAYPLDGGQVLFGFLSLRWGRRRGAELTALIAIPIGAVLAILGFAQNELILGFIGVSVLFEAFQLRWLIRMGEMDAHPAFGNAGPEFDYMPDRPRKKSWFARWREERARARVAREAEHSARLRERVDEVLDKVSREGIGALSPDERRILEEASRKTRGD